MLFSSFLAEQRRLRTESKFSFARIEAVIAAHSPKYLSDAKINFEKLSAAIEVKVIYNADFGDAKATLTRAIEKAYEAVHREDFYENLYARDRAMSWKSDEERRQFLDFDSRSFIGIVTGRSMARHWTSMDGKAPFPVARMRACAEAMADLKEILDFLKPFIVKGRKPAPVDPNKFVKPMAGIAAKTQVGAILKEAAKDVEKKLYASIHSGMWAAVEAFRDAGITDRYSYAKKAARSFIGQKLFDFPKGNYRDDDPAVIKSDSEIEKIVKKLAEDQTKQILEHFIGKNTDKMALIFQKKTGLKSHKILSNNVRNGILENLMFIEFDDGSSFKIFSQVEYARSARGLDFLRMPTRFTDVKMADGSKMSSPSEEKMIKEF